MSTNDEEQQQQQVQPVSEDEESLTPEEQLNQEEFNPNPINEVPAYAFKSGDEFYNDKALPAIKYIHHSIKSRLGDSEHVQFIILTNTDGSFEKWKAEWANNPNLIGKIFREIKDKSELADPVPIQDTTKAPDNYIDVAEIFTAEANDYYTDPDTQVQHFAESIFKYDNDNYWLSKAEGLKQLKIIFNKVETITNLIIDWYKGTETVYEYKIIYNTTERDSNGKPIYDYLRDSETHEPLSLRNDQQSEIQVIQLGELLTNEIVLEFSSPTGGINYLYPVKNKVSLDTIKSFLQLSSDT